MPSWGTPLYIDGRRFEHSYLAVLLPAVGGRLAADHPRGDEPPFVVAVELLYSDFDEDPSTPAYRWWAQFASMGLAEGARET